MKKFFFSLILVFVCSALHSQQTAGGYKLGYDPDGDGYCDQTLLIRRRDHINDAAFNATVKYYLENGWIDQSKCIGFDNCPNDPNAHRRACVRPAGSCRGNMSMCVGDGPPPGMEFCGTTRCGPRGGIVEVFPNPVYDRLNIAAEEGWTDQAEIRLIDPYARVVKMIRTPNAVKGQVFTLFTGDLKPGIYQLTFRNGEVTESRTIAVKL